MLAARAIRPKSGALLLAFGYTTSGAVPSALLTSRRDLQDDRQDGVGQDEGLKESKAVNPEYQSRRLPLRDLSTPRYISIPPS